MSRTVVRNKMLRRLTVDSTCRCLTNRKDIDIVMVSWIGKVSRLILTVWPTTISKSITTYNDHAYHHATKRSRSYIRRARHPRAQGLINRHLPNLIDVLDEDEDEDNLGIIDPTLGGINKLRHNQEESNCEYGSGLEETGELESSGSE